MSTKPDFEIIDVPLNGGEVPLYSQYFQYEKRMMRRLCATLIDFTLVFCFSAPYAYFFSEIIFGSLTPIARELISLGIFTFVHVTYHYYLYRYKCTTFGKRIFSLRVYQYNSLESLTFIQVFFRETIFKLLTIGLFPSSYVHFWMQKEGLTVHDLLTKTMVVIEENPKENPSSESFSAHHSS